MDRSETTRLLSAALIAALGVLLASIFTVDVYQDVVLEGNALWTTLLENSLPYLLSTAILATGLWIGVMDDDVDGVRILRWTVLSLGGALALAAWVYLIQRFQGQVKPRIIVAQLSAAAILGGIVIGVYSDRQRRRQREIAVEKSRLEALFENTSDAVSRIVFEDGEPIVVDVNGGFTETFGYTAGEARGRSFDELFPSTRSTDDLSQFREHARRGERYETEIERERADGTTGVFVVRFVPLSDDVVTADGFTVYTDITETRRYADRLDALHEATRDLIDAGTREAVADRGVDAGAALLDLEISGIYFQTETSEGPVLEPIALTEGARRTFTEIPTLEPGGSLAWRAYESGAVVHFDDVRTADRLHNPETPIRSELIVPLGDHGVFIAGSTTVDDFDEADVALARILGANVRSALDGARREQELRARERELAEQNARLEEFTSIVSHDLRNPLNVATGYLELAEAGDAEALEHVETALGRMEQLIDDLLTLARQGESIGETEPVDLNAVAREAWAAIDGGDARLSIETDTTVQADRDRLLQLLENLLGNAVEHSSTSTHSQARGDAVEHSSTSPPSNAREDAVEHNSTSPHSQARGDAVEQGGDAVAITIGDLPDGTGFYVADDGPGIPEDERETVFESGYTTAEGGTGFGLAIVAEIVDAHGWEIEVTDAEKGGARFEITGIVPAGDDDDTESAGADRPH
ncbi:ATP-binding protein [Halopenitus sp. POP-27]|uniref:sensor histidine kinase n=1 Tax=Halopenitus sp. POP-27 TaxID=2994425 RepID=UPI0024691480|nr:ATP-binding protein [Halopenitus sp. POP-27]